VPIEATIALVVIAFLAIVALIAVTPDAAALRSRRSLRSTSAPEHAREDESVPDPDLRPAALHRVVRVSTWVFLFAATTIVAASGLWPEEQGAILVLLAVGGLYRLVVHEVLVTRLPEVVLHAAEGAMALLFAGFLVALTGGTASPFFFAFPLIVAGAALVVSPGATLILAAAAASTWLVAVAAAGPFPPDAAGLATIGIDLTALTLLAYVGMAIGREQRHAREQTYRLATVDALTGLRTRSVLFGSLERELSRSDRTGRPFCLLMLDLDGLKEVNDEHGHLAGDAALRAVGEVIHAGIRRIDTGARYGGDEFAVLLPETEAEGGRVLAEKLRSDIADLRLSAAGQLVSTSVSVGVVSFPGDGTTVGALLAQADDAMYRSKRDGRDRVTSGAPAGRNDGDPGGRRGGPGVPVMDEEARRTGVEGRPV
jgi:diguanylate cyclase (GGDEF)-like protein